MTPDANFYLTIGAITLFSIVIVSAVSLRGWRDWIAYKRAELDQQLIDTKGSEGPSTVSRIEVADLKERVKKLEAIAAGIDM